VNRVESESASKERKRKEAATMVEIQFEYLGGLHCRATHGPSRQTLTTDAPRTTRAAGSTSPLRI